MFPLGGFFFCGIESKLNRINKFINRLFGGYIFEPRIIFAVICSHCPDFMQELNTVQTSELIDLLSKYTYDYTKMLSQGTSDEEYKRCSMTIKALQAEIESRKANKPTNITTPPDFIIT